MNAFEKFLAYIFVLKYTNKNRKSITRTEKDNGDIIYSVNDRDVIMSVGEYTPTAPKTEKYYLFDTTIFKPEHILENKQVHTDGWIAKQLYNQIAHSFKYSAYQK